MDLAPLTACAWSDSSLAVVASWLTCAGRGDVACVLLKARIAAFDESPDTDAAIRSSQDGRYFSLARVEDGADWELQMLAPSEGNADESCELENHVILRLSEEGSCAAGEECPRLLPSDWKAFRQQVALEERTVRNLQSALQAPVSAPPSALARFFKETWGRFQSQLVEALESLTPPEAVLRFRQACETRERRWFRQLTTDSWTSEVTSSLLTPFTQKADSLRQAAEKGLDAEIRAFLAAETAARGIEGLSTLPGSLDDIVDPAQAEVRKSRNQGERLAGRMGEALVETVRAIQKAAGSLAWAFQKPPFSDALEQVEGWSKRLLDHQMACQVDGFLESLHTRLKSDIATHVASMRAKECRLRALAEGTHRVVVEVAAVEGACPAELVTVALGQAERSAWLKRVAEMPSEDAGATWEWLQAACEGPSSPRAVEGSPGRRSQAAKSASARTPSGASARRGP